VTIRTHLGVMLLMLAASVVMLSPFVNYTSFGSALHSGDGRLQAWVLAWVGNALGTGAPLFDANMFHPARASLSYLDHTVTLGAIGAPLWWITGNAILEFNLLMLVGPALGGYAMFLLARDWTNDTAAAIVAGLAYGFSSFTLLHNSHVKLTWHAGLPLAIRGFERWWAVPSWTRLLGWWIPAIATALVSWYLALMLALLLAAWCVWLSVTADRQLMSTRLVQLTAATALAISVLLPFITPYFGRGDEAAEAAAFAAGWQSYLVPSEHTVIGRWLVGRQIAAPQGFWGERTLFAGWTLLALAAVGVATTHGSRRRHVIFLSIVLAVAVSLSFGPGPHGLAPFDLLARLPGVPGFRASARFALLVFFALAMLAALGVTYLRQRYRPFSTALPILVAVLVLAEVFVIDFPVGKPAPEDAPEIYRLAVEDGARAAVALPMYSPHYEWYLESDYLLYSTTARFLPLANGYGAWVPPEYLAIEEASRGFPSPETAAALRHYGITHVLFHGARFGDRGPALLDRAARGGDFSVVTGRGSDTLLRVTTR
jgi:hypothetical protein